MDKKPIQNISGLFVNYKDDEVVNAKEYNANITALKDAVEYNGNILTKHQDAIANLTVGMLPDGGVTTDSIADNAITKNKLSEDVQQHSLLSPDTISDYFRDLLPSFIHKHDADYTGVLLNGCIEKINARLTHKTKNTVTVKHDRTNCYVYVAKPDSAHGLITKPAQNEAPAETYSLFVNYDEPTWGGHCGWISTIKLDVPYKLGKSNSDTFTFSWTCLEGQHSDAPDVYSDLTQIVLKDPTEKEIATLFSFGSDNLFKHTTKRETDRATGGIRVTHTCTLNPNEILFYENVQYIEIYQTMTYRFYGRGYNTIEAGITVPSFYPEANISLNSLQDAIAPQDFTVDGTEYSNVLWVPGSAPALTITAWLETQEEVDLNNTGTVMQIVYTTQVPDNLHESQEALEPGAIYSAYIPTKGNLKVISSDKKHHFVEWVAQPPVVVSGTVDGQTYSWLQDETNYLYADALGKLKDTYEIEDIALTPFKAGSDYVNLKLSTTLTDMTINSISVARYNADL